MKAKLSIFLIGCFFGLTAAVLMPRFWNSLLPQGLKGEPVEGVVESKGGEGDHLLLTLVTDEGAVLATFRRQVTEIDLLVGPGDTVSLALGGYRPFVEDPEIVRVVKARPEPERKVLPTPVPVEPPQLPQVEETPTDPEASVPEAVEDLG